ncbi:MAG: hypothetical protein WDM90_20290 [Ferruginibacter sp.]
MNLHRTVALITICFLSATAQAQFFAQKNYPQGYFSWPVIAKKALAANFGELRPNHYHMGLDCKTDQKQNVQVVASAGRLYCQSKKLSLLFWQVHLYQSPQRIDNALCPLE